MSSSTEFFASDSVNTNADSVMHQLDQPYCDAVEKVCVVHVVNSRRSFDVVFPR